VALCPKCKQSFPADVRRCPTDGTPLAVTLSTPKVQVNAVGQTAVAKSSPPASKTVPAKSVSASRPISNFEEEPTSLADSQPDMGAIPQAPMNIPNSGDVEMAPGTQVGEYQVTGKLGEGGMGTVFAAVHPVIGKKVAIKVLNAGLSQDESIVQRFVQEARSVNQIGHRNIVDIFAFGQLPSGRQYFVMEFLSGKSLKQWLDEGPMSYADAFSVLHEVADALSAAHAEGIVHRDLKPDNIFLAENKRGGKTVKLLDFGIAKLLRGDDGHGVHQTRTGAPMGTPLFMSPEQCLGKPVDARTDIYSLGVIMFELFTGRLPFPGPSYIETVNGHISQAPPNPTELADIPEPLAAVILHCLEKDPANRPATVDELRATLNKVATEMGTEGRKTSGQHPTLGTATPVRRTPLPRTTPPPAASPAAAKKPIALYAVGGAVVAALLGGGVVMMRRSPPPAPVAPPAAAPHVSLQVLSNPGGAAVFVDGKKQPLLTPYTYDLPYAPNLKLRVELPGYAAYEENVALAAGETAHAVVATLQPLNLPGGQLQVRSNAKKATWTLDGKPVGDGSNLLKVADLPPGHHTLRIEAKGFDPREEPIDVQSRQLASFEWNLTPASSGKKHHGSSPGGTTPGPSGGGGEDENAISGWPPH
jgi:serine/threonine-protein kinase